eukprot:2108246-Prymnesium_polylepis.1
MCMWHVACGMCMCMCMCAHALTLRPLRGTCHQGDAPQPHKESVLGAGYHDTVRTLVFTGRPCRIRKNPYVMDWEENRAEEMKATLVAGKLPYTVDEGKGWTADERKAATPWLMGQVKGPALTQAPRRAPALTPNPSQPHPHPNPAFSSTLVAQALTRAPSSGP